MSKGQTISEKQIENHIFTIRGFQVMLDSDLAEIYNVPTGRLNEQVKRNIERFPEDFVFQLTQDEWQNLKSNNEILSLRSQNATLKDMRGKHRKYLPFVFTEHGVAGLSGILKSEIAAAVHVTIMRAFISMRKFLIDNATVLHRLDRIELKQLGTDQKNIVLIDNYIDETTLTHLSKKEKGVKVHLFTKTISKQLSLDVQKANEQYDNFELKPFAKSHDRFLIIDTYEDFH